MNSMRAKPRPGIKVKNPHNKLAVVTMEETLEHDAQPGVPREKEATLEICEEVFGCLQLDQPKVNAVLEALVDSDIILFACYGMADVENLS